MHASGHKYAIVASRFNSFIVDRLVEGALDTLKRHGCNPDDIVIYKVPGGFELPMIASKVAQKGGIDAVIALGAVIRGSTPHFDYVAGEATKGLAQVSLNHDLPMSFGLLTCDTIEQAIERAGTKSGNKGSEAAGGAIEMVSLFKTIDGEASS
jgi:6,7-dimethyl-8-ribityllumazine synthase